MQVNLSTGTKSFHLSKQPSNDFGTPAPEIRPSTWNPVHTQKRLQLPRAPASIVAMSTEEILRKKFMLSCKRCHLEERGQSLVKQIRDEFQGIPWID